MKKKSARGRAETGAARVAKDAAASRANPPAFSPFILVGNSLFPAATTVGTAGSASDPSFPVPGRGLWFILRTCSVGAKWTGSRVRARRRKTSSARNDASRVEFDATRERPASLAYRRSTRSSSAAASVPREANMPRQQSLPRFPLPSSLGSFCADIFTPANLIFFRDCLPIRALF